MTEIAERLRQGVDPDDIQETERAMDNGADEIERLRAALRIAWSWMPNVKPESYEPIRSQLQRAHDMVRQALG